MNDRIASGLMSFKSVIVSHVTSNFSTASLYNPLSSLLQYGLSSQPVGLVAHPRYHNEP